MLLKIRKRIVMYCLICYDRERKTSREKTGGDRMSFVLIVEPEEVNASRIRTILESLELDFEYELVRSAEAAIASVENHKPDIFIGDMQMPVMSGTELFSMIEMMSPDTVRIVMTDGGNIQETVSFMNECRAYKIIMKPCRVADDLLVPIRAALLYKEQCERASEKAQVVDTERRAIEDAFTQVDAMWRQNMDNLKRAQAVVSDMISSNISANSVMTEKVQERTKRWYQWMIEEYVRLVINGSGDYEQMARAQVAFCHEPKYNCMFQMKKNTQDEIEPRCVNEIGYILRIVTGVCKDLQMSYQMQAVIDKTDKAYILRVRYLLERDENGVELAKGYRVRTPEIREAIKLATTIGVEALGYKAAVLKKEQDDILNIAIPR